MVTSTTTPNYWKEEAMKNNQLLNNYYDSCNALLEAFCKKHYFDYEDARQSWVAGGVGEIVCCGDYYFNMDVIVTDLKEDAPEEELIKWYDYNTECSFFGINGCNYHSWLKGCPKLSENEIEEIRQYQKIVEDAKKQLDECVSKYKERGF